MNSEKLDSLLAGAKTDLEGLLAKASQSLSSWAAAVEELKTELLEREKELNIKSELLEKAGKEGVASLAQKMALLAVRESKLEMAEKAQTGLHIKLATRNAQLLTAQEQATVWEKKAMAFKKERDEERNTNGQTKRALEEALHRERLASKVPSEPEPAAAQQQVVAVGA